MELKQQVSGTLEATYQGSSHTTPSTEPLVWQIADVIRTQKLQVFQLHRVQGDYTFPLVTDVLAVGHEKVLHSTLQQFNKRMAETIARLRTGSYEDEDHIPVTVQEERTDSEISVEYRSDVDDDELPPIDIAYSLNT